MKFTIFQFCLFLSFTVWSQSKSTGNFNEGFARTSYTSVKGCKVEFQSFDSTLTENDLNMLLSYLYRIGSKDRGIEKEFKTYRSFDFSGRSKTKKEIITYSKSQIKLFRSGVKELKTRKVPSQFVELRDELYKINSQKLKFEEIFDRWYKSGDDLEFRTQIVAFYSDVYVVATLDKTLAIKDYVDKLKYTHAELYDIFNSKVFPNDGLIELQNKILHKYKIEIILDGNCNK